MIKTNLEGRTSTIHDRKSFYKTSSGKSKAGKHPVVTDKNQNEDQYMHISIPTKPRENVGLHRARLGNMNINRVYYNKLANPKMNKLI